MRLIAPSLPSLLLVALLQPYVQALTSACKCHNADPCWPSIEDWASFNSSVSGHLIRAVPPASVCYQSEPNYNETACESVIASWASSPYHSAHPISVPSVWSNNTCEPVYPNGTSITGDPDAGARGCGFGSLPEFVVNATEATHVKEALLFAADRGLRINIKNTGHNGAGRNVGAGSLSIWTHNMKDMEFHDVFQPQGCSSRGNSSAMAVTIGAGVQAGELLSMLRGKNSIAVTGTNLDVGILGWATGGGHGFMTGDYGMGADNIVEASIVTPTGENLIANACQNEDLFWAIRGGGGGTFGVITNMTMKAYPVPAMLMAGLNIDSKNGTSAKEWWRLIAELHTLFPGVQRQGVKGYYTMSGSNGNWNYAGSFFLWNAPNGTFERAMEPIRDRLDAAAGIVTYEMPVVPVPSFYDLLDMLPATEKTGSTSITASRFISRDTVANRTELLAETLEKVGPKAVAPTDGSINPTISGTMTIYQNLVDNSLNPGWRDAVVHLITNYGWTTHIEPEIVSSMVTDMTYNKLGALIRLNPESGTYLNEANTFEPGWQWSFYGQNYARLLSIKQKYDPNDLLWCNQCVGSEGWSQIQDGRLCQSYMPFQTV